MVPSPLAVREEPLGSHQTSPWSGSPPQPILARTRDSGQHFEFVSRLVPWSDPCRAVMPASVRRSPARIVAALRRKSASPNWIDCVHPGETGATWAHPSRVADTVAANSFSGNSPALVALAGGRLCCAYGNRTERRMLAAFSTDAGASWGEPLVLRDDFQSANGWPDLGYPRLFERGDGWLVAVTFWYTRERPETHIEATIFPSPRRPQTVGTPLPEGEGSGTP
jgi:hypothetical protein